jgi:hypothetical protein
MHLASVENEARRRKAGTAPSPTADGLRATSATHEKRPRQRRLAARFGAQDPVSARDNLTMTLCARSLQRRRGGDFTWAESIALPTASADARRETRRALPARGYGARHYTALTTKLRDGRGRSRGALPRGRLSCSALKTTPLAGGRPNRRACPERRGIRDAAPPRRAREAYTSRETLEKNRPTRRAAAFSSRATASRDVLPRADATPDARVTTTTAPLRLSGCSTTTPCAIRARARQPHDLRATRSLLPYLDVATPTRSARRQD